MPIAHRTSGEPSSGFTVQPRPATRRHSSVRNKFATWHRAAFGKSRRAAAAGIGNSFMFGKPGILTRNPQEAVHWYAKAAFRSDGTKPVNSAQLMVGHCYAAGVCTGRADWPKAAQWYLAAARNRNTDAQYAIGICHLSGDGISRDASEGLFWLRTAAQAGHVRAMDALGKYHFRNGDEPEGKRWWRRAAARGNDVAATRLAQAGPGKSENRKELVKSLQRPWRELHLVQQALELSADGLLNVDVAVDVEDELDFMEQDDELTDACRNHDLTLLECVPFRFPLLSRHRWHVPTSGGELGVACRQLLDATPDVNVSDSNGQTPLLSAIAASFMEGVMLLLIRGADVTLAGHVHARREADGTF